MEEDLSFICEINFHAVFGIRSKASIWIPIYICTMFWKCQMSRTFGRECRSNVIITIIFLLDLSNYARPNEDAQISIWDLTAEHSLHKFFHLQHHHSDIPGIRLKWKFGNCVRCSRRRSELSREAEKRKGRIWSECRDKISYKFRTLSILHLDIFSSTKVINSLNSFPNRFPSEKPGLYWFWQQVRVTKIDFDRGVGAIIHLTFWQGIRAEVDFDRVGVGPVINFTF